MSIKRRILFRIGAVGLLLLVAGTMLVVGRGHTVYIDNKGIEYEGQNYIAPYKTVVYIDGKQVAKLYDKERGMATCIGQKITMSLEITETKGGTEETITITIPLPLRMDGIIINLPAFLAGLPEKAYLTEFVIAPVEPSEEDEEVVTDEFDLLEE